MKKTLSFILALVMILTAVPFAFAVNTEKPFDNSLFYEVNDDYTLHYRTYEAKGQQKNQILLIHGFCLSTATFEGLAEIYAEKDSWNSVTKSSDDNKYLNDVPWENGERVMLIRTDIADSIVNATIERVKEENPEIDVESVEFDCDDGNFVYEIEFRTEKREYEYEIHAKSGDVIKRESERYNKFDD